LTIAIKENKKTEISAHPVSMWLAVYLSGNALVSINVVTLEADPRKLGRNWHRMN